jgi:hypothetical protein
MILWHLYLYILLLYVLFYLMYIYEMHPALSLKYRCDKKTPRRFHLCPRAATYRANGPIYTSSDNAVHGYVHYCVPFTNFSFREATWVSAVSLPRIYLDKQARQGASATSEQGIIRGNKRIKNKTAYTYGWKISAGPPLHYSWLLSQCRIRG